MNPFDFRAILIEADDALCKASKSFADLHPYRRKEIVYTGVDTWLDIIIKEAVNLRRAMDETMEEEE